MAEISRKPVIVIAIVTALCLVGDSMLYIVLPIYWKEAGLTSLWEVGVILSVNRFIRLPLNPIVGWIYRKISLRTGLLIAVCLGGFTTLGYGFAQGLAAWVVLRALWGSAWSFLRIGGLYAVARCSTDNNRGEMMGLYNGLYRLGSLAGMLLGGILVAIIGFDNISLAFGCTSLLGVLLLLKSTAVAHRIDEQRPASETKSIIRSKRVYLVLFSGFFVALVFQGVLTSTLSYLIQSYGEEVSLLGIVLAASAWSGILLAFRWIWEPFLATHFGRLSDGPRGRIPLYLVSLLVSAVGLTLMPLALPFALWVTVTLIVLMGATSLTTLTDALATDAAKSRPSVSLLAFYSLAQDLGAALGPVIGYLFIEWGNSLSVAYVVSAGVFIGMMWLWYRMDTIAKLQEEQYSA